MPEEIQVRWSLKRDLADMIRIASWSDLARFCWAESDFMAVLSRHDTIAMVAECDEAVVGFVVYELNPDHLAILNMGVDLPFRRRGVGSAIITCLADKLNHQRRRSLRITVPEPLLRLQLLLKQHGFVAVACEPNGYLMRLDKRGDADVSHQKTSHRESHP